METNIAGYTLEQRLRLINIDQNKSEWELFQPVLKAFFWTCQWLIIIFGAYMILRYLYNHYKAKRNK